MFAYLSKEAGDVVKPETLRRYCEESAANIDWLGAHGVPYASDVYTEKTLYPPDGKFLYYAGNEKVPEYAAIAKPAPRGHRPVGTGMTGHVYFAALAQAAAERGVRVARHEQARRLLVDARGHIIGVETTRIRSRSQLLHQQLYAKVVPMLPFKADVAERAGVEARALEQQDGETRMIRARRGVIIATGGFAFNLEMLRRHRPFFAENYRALMRLGSLGCDGSGIMIGQAAGGATARMDSVFAGRNIAPPNALLEGILINVEGERFINEEAYSGRLGLAIAEQTGGKAWLILNAASFRAAIKQSLLGGFLFFKYYGVPALLNFVLGGTRRARSVTRMAKKCGMNAAALERTIAAHNSGIKNGATDKFGKSAANSKPFDSGAFYAVNMSTANLFAFTYLFTLGGLQVDEENGAVLCEDGSTIHGLYAAGRAAVGLCSNGYLSGMSIGDGMFSGRRAGRAAALAADATPHHQVAGAGWTADTEVTAKVVYCGLCAFGSSEDAGMRAGSAP